MKEIAKRIYIDPNEVQAIEEFSEIEYDTPSGSSGFSFKGSVVILKITGRKIYVRGKTASEIYKIINEIK